MTGLRGIVSQPGVEFHTGLINQGSALDIPERRALSRERERAVQGGMVVRGFGLSLAFQASMRRLAIVKRGAGGNFSYGRTSDRASIRTRVASFRRRGAL